ncbi:MAG: hypothetical protein ACFWTZ_00045 [Burkholderia sp.]|jgi:hypothetical protein
MGGLGSGRLPWRRRETVEDCRGLGIRNVKRGWRGLSSGRRETFRWTRKGKPYGAADVFVKDGTLHISYLWSKPGNEDWNLTDCAVAIDKQPCHFGGERWWFICPRCGRRTSVLFISEKVGCRCCMGLTYRSAKADRIERFSIHMNRIKRRLGGEELQRPKGMHACTYDRLMCEYRTAARQQTDAKLEEALKLLRRLESAR